MRTIVGLASLSLFTTLVFACTVTTSTTDAPTDGGTTPTTDAGRPDTSATDGGGNTSILGFSPTNVDVSQLDFSGVGDLVISTTKTWQTGLGGLVGSDNAGTYHYKEVTQTDGSTIGVATVNSITIEPGVTVTLNGAYPLVIIALDKIDIQGAVQGNSQFNPTEIGVGVKRDDAQGSHAGDGPGGGGAGSGATAGGGAGYCGVGGTASATTGAAANGGGTYGNQILAPLLAGSNAGSAFADPGLGGGAVQLVAKNAITVSGTLNMSGGGGGHGGVFNGGTSQNASGGGSGGAVLLEAGTVSVTGTIAANGGAGGGGSNERGADGTASSTPAAGGSVGGSPGGNGSGGTTINGSPGSVSANTSAGAGGGAAGRIRINTKSGAATITGTISPATTTTCVTQGTLI